MHRKTEAFIDLNAIRSNYALACKLAPGSKNIAIIKANGYGHGMLRVAEALQDTAPAFGVATIDEALELRQANNSHPLLVLEGNRKPNGGEVKHFSNPFDHTVARVFHIQCSRILLSQPPTPSQHLFERKIQRVAYDIFEVPPARACRETNTL